MSDQNHLKEDSYELNAAFVLFLMKFMEKDIVLWERGSRQVACLLTYKGKCAP